MKTGDWEKIWRCTSGDSHFISIRYWDVGEDKDREGCLVLESVYITKSFWDRLKTIWHILWHGNCILDEVLIESYKEAEEIADAIMEIGRKMRAGLPPAESLPGFVIWADRTDEELGKVLGREVL